MRQDGRYPPSEGRYTPDTRYSDSPRGYGARNYNENNRYQQSSENMDWQKAAEAWAARSRSKYWKNRGLQNTSYL